MDILDRPLIIDPSEPKQPNSILIVDDSEGERLMIKQIVRELLEGTLPDLSFIETNCYDQALYFLARLESNPDLRGNILGFIYDKNGFRFKDFGEGIGYIPMSTNDSGMDLALRTHHLYGCRPNPPIIIASTGNLSAAKHAEYVGTAVCKDRINSELPSAVTKAILGK